MKKIKQILNKLKKAFTLSKELDIDDRSNWSFVDWIMFILVFLGFALVGIMKGC
jgi:hypothetical protein